MHPQTQPYQTAPPPAYPRPPVPPPPPAQPQQNPQYAARPMPYYPAQPRWNSCAVIGFLMALCPVTCIAGFILGVVGAVQCGKTKARGMGLAIAGILAGALWVFLAVLYIYRFGLMLLDTMDWLLEEPERFNYSYTMLMQRIIR